METSGNQGLLVPIGLGDIKKQVSTLQIAERFFDSVALFSLFELGVFRGLAQGGRTLDELHAGVGGSRETLRAVLDAAVALRILARAGDRYEAPAALLDCLGREESPAYLGEWVAFLHSLAAPLLELGEAVRTSQPPGALFEDMSAPNLPAKRMTRAMDAYARSRGAEMADRIDCASARTLLDLGCGPGTYALALLARYPRLHATLLDLPGPISEAREIVAAYGFSDRVEFIAADAMTYEFEHGYDAVLVSNTLHMLGPDLSRRLLARCLTIVNPGGRLIVQAQYLNDDRTSPRWPTLLNLIQRVATPHGRNHDLGETRRWLEEAGFVDVEYVPFSPWNVNSALIGYREVPRPTSRS